VDWSQKNNESVSAIESTLQSIKRKRLNLGNSATIDAIDKTMPRLAAPFHARSLKKTDRSFEKDK